MNVTRRNSSEAMIKTNVGRNEEQYFDVPGSPCLSKKGESNVWFVPFKIFLSRWLSSLIGPPVDGPKDPWPVSCRCPSGSLETPPRWHATIYIISSYCVHIVNRESL